MAKKKETAPVAAAAPVAEVKEATAAPAEKKPAAKKTASKKAPAAKKAAAKAPAEKKTAKAAPAAEKKAAKAPAAKKEAAAKAPSGNTIYFEIGEKKIAAKDILDMATQAFKAAHPRTAIKSMEIYVKAEESAAYYVVNGKADGEKIDL